MPDTVTIRDFVLRLPGLRPGEARAIAEEVARRLAEETPPLRFRPLPLSLDLRVRVPANARRDELPRLIAGQIARALR